MIHGTRHQTKVENAENKRRVERSFGDFRRTVRLPKAVDKDAIAARYDHRVLTVTLPKAAKSGSRRIVVSHGEESEGGTESKVS